MRFRGICITYCLCGHKGQFIVYLALGKIFKNHRRHLYCFLYLLYYYSKTITLTKNVTVIMRTCSLLVKIFRVTESENAAVIWNA